MSSIGTGYDLSATTFSPDGRVFQMEYALKAVENSGTAIGLRVKDGVVFAVEKLVISKMLVPGSNRRVHTVDRHAGLAAAGLVADARQLVNRARAEAKNYRSFYGDSIQGRVLAERLASFMQMYTLYGSVRPFGTSVLVGCVDKQGPQLFMIDPSGLHYGYYGCAVGKGARAANTELEKLKLSELTAREALKEAAKIIYSVHDDVKDKAFELELSWVCAETNNEHQLVPDELKAEAEREAKAALESDEESESESDEDDLRG
ncbi:putative proteasome subunit alpha type-7 [Balamuthia mandrillaris]